VAAIRSLLKLRIGHLWEPLCLDNPVAAAKVSSVAPLLLTGVWEPNGR
jgi:hypothetical protein